MLAARHRALDAAPGAVAKADGGIERLGGEVDLVVVGLQAQLDVGVAGLEVGHAGEQMAVQVGADHGDGEALGRGAVVEQGEGGIELGKGLLHGGGEAGAFVTELQTARGAQEERLADLGLQRLDLLADGGLRHAELLRRAGEAEVPRSGGEGVQAVERVASEGHQKFLWQLQEQIVWTSQCAWEECARTQHTTDQLPLGLL